MAFQVSKQGLKVRSSRAQGGLKGGSRSGGKGLRVGIVSVDSRKLAGSASPIRNGTPSPASPEYSSSYTYDLPLRPRCACTNSNSTSRPMCLRI